MKTGETAPWSFLHKQLDGTQEAVGVAFFGGLMLKSLHGELERTHQRKPGGVPRQSVRPGDANHGFCYR
jgi:hypothetical protein